MRRLRSPQLQPIDSILIFLSALLGAQVVAIPIYSGFLDPDSAWVFFAVALIQDGLFLVLIALFLKLRGQSWAHIRLNDFQARHLLHGVGGGLGLYLLMTISILLLQLMVPGGLPPQNVEAYMDPAAADLDKALVFFVVVFLAPLAEEILFRGYLLRSIENVMSSKAAIFWSGLLFGVVHGDLLRLLPLSLGGWVLAWMARKYESLWPPILAHSIWNFIMILVMYAF